MEPTPVVEPIPAGEPNPEAEPNLAVEPALKIDPNPVVPILAHMTVTPFPIPTPAKSGIKTSLFSVLVIFASNYQYRRRRRRRGSVAHELPFTCDRVPQSDMRDMPSKFELRSV